MKKDYCHITISLNKHHKSFIEDIIKKCRKKGTKKLCNSAILRAILEIGKTLNIKTKGIKSEKELKIKFLEYMGKKTIKKGGDK